MDNDKPTPIEAIDFKSLNKHTEDDSIVAQRSAVRSPLYLVAFLFLIICSIGVFLLLPKYVPEKQTSIPIPSSAPIESVEQPELDEPLIEEAPELSAEELNKLKIQTEKLLLEVIKLQKSLESKGVKKWAQDKYSQASALATVGDENFRKQRYPDAINSYQQAIDTMEALQDKVAPTLAMHLEQGEHALSQANRETALFHFELAKAIDAENTQALNGIKSAETIEELFQLLEKGGNLEAANRLEDAKQIYQQALELDSLSSDANSAIQRVSSRLVEIEFSALIASGYSALDARQFNDASSAFQSAQRLLPNSEKPKQGLAKVARAIRKEKISALFVEAQHFESREEWEYAVQSYQQILALDLSSSTAQKGITHSQTRAALLQSLDGYLNDHERLFSEEVANEANDLLQEISSLQAPGNKISQRADTLKQLLLKTKQPVFITLQSDNQTDIVIFKVGKFGRFENHRIELKPGKYTIVGSRPGYRDFRKVLTVTADMTSKTIMVRCEEPI